MATPTILIAEDDTTIRTVLHEALTRKGYTVEGTDTATGLQRWIEGGKGDLVITDVMLPDANIFDIIPHIKSMRRDLPIIVISAQNTVLTAIQAAEMDVYEYFPKPFDIPKLLAAVEALFAPRQTIGSQQNKGKAAARESLPIIGRSQAMQKIYLALSRLLYNDLCVLVYGESGTGKELIARILHDYGHRRDGPFVAINMAAIPYDLIESELFGHDKGAFTGADEAKTGKFEQAEGGTLFLDEIGDMPLEAQTRLLRVLQQGEFTPLGSKKSKKANVRVLSATHQDLQRMIKDGTFREDLFFRLNVVPLRLPPLRDRVEDIPELIDHFFQISLSQGGKPRNFTADAMDFLAQQEWSGNVRELQNLIKRLSVLHRHETITLTDLKKELPGNADKDADTSNAIESEPRARGKHAATPTLEKELVEALPIQSSLSEAIFYHLEKYFAAHSGELPATGLYARVINEVEKPLLELVLQATRQNQVRAADLLGLNRNTLRKKLKAHGLIKTKDI